jgi:hypothetical protein
VARGAIVSVPVDAEHRLRQVWRHRLRSDDAGARDGAAPVLLIHAATLGRDMFLEPQGGFARYLLEKKAGGAPAFDVLTLDWRASNNLLGKDGGPAVGASADEFRVDKVAEDIQFGVRVAARLHPGKPVRIVAHCMGAAATAHAIASGAVGDVDAPVGDVVLATIGLFYRLGIDNALKTSENVMRLLEASQISVLSPHVDAGAAPAWPADFESMYRMWRSTLMPHGCGNDFCDRLWFMFGGDYRAVNIRALHDQPGFLQSQFGAMPVGLYNHIVVNCQRGFAVPWASQDSRELLNARRFEGRRITLLTGDENQVWHRDSIDTMYEWLLSAVNPRTTPVRKVVVPFFGHVDLWWSAQSQEHVFTKVLQGIA